ncbi:MAG: OmpA family protein [Lewinellaceae bacterium]|nr:OmpA family protein [Lewinellaceae bacterium]
MSKIPLWLIALLFVGYSIWAVRFWHCHVCKCCDDQALATETVKTSGVPLFKWNANKPEADANFAAWKKDLLARGGQGDTLLITGWQRAGETAELGRARAEALKSMMMPEVAESRIQLANKAVEDALADGGPPMVSADFSWRKMVLAMEAGAIIETDNDVIFLFPFKSTEKDKNPEVDAYLTKLVEKHKSTTTTFSVIGHTDGVGTDEDNLQLGLGRARAIAKFLTDHGIASARIKVESKGKREPVADNNTEDGRHQNRRVVLTVNR